jgi:hypothetical protein
VVGLGSRANGLTGQALTSFPAFGYWTCFYRPFPVSPQVFGHSDNRNIACFANPDTMSVSNSNTGGTKFKFVASDGGVSQKRSQVAQACEHCRKRKKRCNHAERTPRPSGVTSHVHHSPAATSPSSTSQAAPIESPANSTIHQFPTSSGPDEGQYHAKTSLNTSNPVEGNNQRTKSAEATETNDEVQVCRFSI